MKLLYYLLRTVFILIFPFAVFVRSAVYLHTTYELPGLMSVMGAAGILAFVLFIYLTIGYKIFFDRIGSGGALKQRMIFLVLFSVGILIHLLFFVSNKHVKSDDLRHEFYELHPILRMATGIFMKIDRDLVMTDISRKSSDYTEMGLPVNERSLHYPQKDGYSYALDLRTKNKSPIINFAMTWYYRLLGFDTLRHVGTADHLHVALYCPPRLRR